MSLTVRNDGDNPAHVTQATGEFPDRVYTDVVVQPGEQASLDGRIYSLVFDKIVILDEDGNELDRVPLPGIEFPPANGAVA